MLAREVQKRSRLVWSVGSNRTDAQTTVRLEVGSVTGPEGYTIQVQPATAAGRGPVVTEPPATVTVLAADERGFLFGVGRFLRLLSAVYSQGYKTAPVSNVTVPANVTIRSAPRFPLRGHQLGYRPKTNAYDAWTLAQYEQYIVELSLFGTNTIELIPWHSDDVPFSPMFALGPQETLFGVSAILQKYGLDCSLWYPMMEKNYSDPETMQKATAEWSAVFGGMKRLDMIQIPAGDPGSHSPATLLNITQALAATAKRFFPKVRVWLGPQEWSPSEMDDWERLARQFAQLGLLDGVVYGPHTPQNLTRFLLREPADLPVRLYPDITHSLSTQFPVPLWDRAFAITQSRESINPRPRQYAHIASLHLNNGRVCGFSSYSEGVNDDVNKAIWSAVAWGSDEGDAFGVPTAAGAGSALDALVNRTVTDYARVFISPAHSDKVAEVIFGLEQAWVGPVEVNTAIPTTFARVLAVEAVMTADQARNWRLQQLRYRASYDAFLQMRHRRETSAEESALATLQVHFGQPGAVSYLLTAVAQLSGGPEGSQLARAVVSPRASDDMGGVTELGALTRVHSLAALLFSSIGMQLSVNEFFAEFTVRGANLDTIMTPLNNAPYIVPLLLGAMNLSDEEAWDLVRPLLAWNQTAQGGFYDDLGRPGHQPHVVHQSTWEEDPDYYVNPLCACAIPRDVKWSVPHPTLPPTLDTQPVPWQTFAVTFYNAPLVLRYNISTVGAASWTVEVVYPSPNTYEEDNAVSLGMPTSTPPPEVKLSANGHVVHDFLPPPLITQRQQFLVPLEATTATEAELELVWTMPDDVGGNGVGCKVAEVLLYPTPAPA